MYKIKQAIEKLAAPCQQRGLGQTAAVGSEKSSRWRTAGIGSDRTALMAENLSAALGWRPAAVWQ